jgi:hypothetical protein
LKFEEVKTMQKFNFFGKEKDSKKSGTYESGDFLTEFAQVHPIPEDGDYRGVSADVKGKEIRLRYNGMLVKNGAHDVYAAVSYGDNNNWTNVKYYPMGKTEHNTFEAILPVKRNTTLNVAFKDGADNWDNNSGSNYRFIES